MPIAPKITIGISMQPSLNTRSSVLQESKQRSGINTQHQDRGAQHPQGQQHAPGWISFFRRQVFALPEPEGKRDRKNIQRGQNSGENQDGNPCHTHPPADLRSCGHQAELSRKAAKRRQAYQRGREKAIAKGIKPGIGIAVLMVGRLDDYLRDVMNDTRVSATESDVICAGTAAIKRAYGIFKEKGYDCVLMPAGCRGGYHIADLAGADMVMSIAPGIAAKLQDNTEFVEKIDAPVDPAVIERLSEMPEFIKGYAPDGMTVNEFITFGSCNRTLDQFVQMGWNVLKGFAF